MVGHGMEKLKIDNEFKNLLPPLTSDEYSQLEDDIKKHGVLSPIITWNGYIIDGHNRYEICRKNKIDLPEIKSLDFANKSDVMDWIINHQTGRRNLTKSQLVKAYASVEEQLKREAKERQGQRNDLKNNIAVNLPQSSKKKRNPETTTTIAKKMGVSRKTYEGMKTVVAEGSAEQIKRMDKGGKGNGVSAIVAEIKEEKASKDVPEGYRRCSLCGAVKPLSAFDKQNGKKSGYRSRCKECRRVNEKKAKNPFGEETRVSPAFRAMTMEDIEGDLYERKSMNFDNVVDEIDEVFKSCVSSLDNIFRMNKEALESPENSKIVYEKVIAFKEQMENKAKEFKNE